jgi:hypothetical protein
LTKYSLKQAIKISRTKNMPKKILEKREEQKT